MLAIRRGKYQRMKLVLEMYSNTKNIAYCVIFTTSMLVGVNVSNYLSLHYQKGDNKVSTVNYGRPSKDPQKSTSQQGKKDSEVGVASAHIGASNLIQTTRLINAIPVQDQSTVQINEQFAGSSLNPAYWYVVTRQKGYRNNEEQDYLPAQVSVENGVLSIRATRDSAGRWHSGEVNSKWSFRYGDFETRIALSETGKGVWPAAWLLNSENKWPNGGEIDMFENINGEASAYGALRGGGTNGVWSLQKHHGGINIKEYHTYKVIKRPGYMSWWIDGVKRGEWRKSEVPKGAVWPFDNYKYYGLLNLAIGGTWPGESDNSTPPNIIMYVDYFTVKNAY